MKAVDPLLRVGGPASAGSGANAGTPPWGKEFLAACHEEQLPLDFFSTHPYPTIHTSDLSGQAEMTWDGPDRLRTDLTGARDILVSSGYPGIERHYTEWSSSPSPRDRSHDTAFMYQMLSRLGTTELAGGDSYAVTRREDGSLAILLWNYCHYRDSAHFTQQASSDVYQQFEAGPAKRFELAISRLDGLVRVQATRVDRDATARAGRADRMVSARRAARCHAAGDQPRRLLTQRPCPAADDVLSAIAAKPSNDAHDHEEVFPNVNFSLYTHT